MNRRRLLGYAAAAVGGYLIGSVSFARIVGKVARPEEELTSTPMLWGEAEGFDVANVSATTIETTVSPRLGVLTASFDIAKAAVPAFLLRRAYPDEHFDVVCATAVMAGHIHPLYYRGPGGRGTSTLLGGLLVFDPLSIPVTIVGGQAFGLLVLRDAVFAHHAAWIMALPLWFALRRQPALVGYALAVNALRWGASIPELQQWWGYYRSGELRTQEFHEVLEQTHMGYIHKQLRTRGWITYDYMRAEQLTATAADPPPPPDHPAEPRNG